MTATVWALLAFCIALEVMRELCFKAAADDSGEGGYFAALARRPVLWLGLTAWAVEVVAWVAVLQRAPLTIAFPIMTVTYAAIPIAGHWLLKERLSARQSAGAALVAVGVICVGVAGR
jgi:undecaprenyl phosphate-alpha-L-ara4N flippase subunit ArnE